MVAACARPRRRARSRGAALALVAAMVAGLLTAITGTAAAAPASVQLQVAADGTAPFDTLDANAANGIVRTRDTVTYQWNYSAPSGESILFVHTLTTSSLIRFEASNTAQCTGSGGGSISADGHTLTCSVLADPTGSGSVPITVKPSGVVPNGTIIASSMTADGLSGGSTTTTVVGQPQLDLRANLWGATTSASVGGAAGNGFIYSFVISEAAGAKGTEGVSAPLTFTTDLSTLTPNATLVPGSCSPNNRGGAAIPYGKVGIQSGATTTNSVVDSGTITCSMSGQVLTVTITGANLDGATSPTLGAQGNALTARTYLVAGIFTVFVPSTDIGGSINRTLQYKNFDPTSGTGQSNYGTGYDAGSEPTAATCPYTADNSSRANDNCFSTTFAPRQAGWGNYFVTADTSVSATAAGEATSGTGGDGVASPGELFYDRVTIYSTSGPSLTNPAVCTKWNASELHVVGLGRAWKGATQLSASDYTVEYGTLTMGTDAQRRSTSCSTGSWYSSVAAAGGAAAVNAVRFVYNGTVANGEFVLFMPQMEVQPVATGTIVATFSSSRLSTAEGWSASFYVRETNVPNYTGNRMTISDGRLRVTQSNNVGSTQSVQAGATYTYTVTPTVTRNTTAITGVPGVTVTSTLPSCARYVPDSASVPVELQAANNGADGIPCTADSGETGPKLVFKLGSVVPGTTIPPITFQVRILRVAADNTTAAHSAVISSDASVAIDLSKRTSTGGITVRNQTQFALAETTGTPQISGDGSVDYLFAWRNLSGLTVPKLTIISELPYTGDANGSTFTGTLRYAGSTVPSGATLECTSDPHGTISSDPSSTANSYGSTCNAATTALRITVTNLTNAAIDRVAVRLTAAGSSTGNKYVSTTQANYVPNGSTTPVALPAGDRVQVTVVSSTISGLAWSDANNDGIRQAGEVVVAGMTVTLSGTDDLGSVSRSTTTGSDGTYSFGALRAGSYVVTFNGGSPPVSSAFSPKGAGSNRSVDSSVNPGTGATDSITLGTGAAVSAVDAGVYYSAPTVSLAASAASVAFTGPVTLTATVAVGVTGTIDFTDAVTTGPQAGSTVPLGSATISGGTATWTGPLPAYGVNTTRATLRAGGVYPTATSGPAVVENTAGTTDLLITQFRQSGPGGGTDQFVQILNRSAFPVPLGGVVARAADGTAATLPASAGTLAAGRSFLLAGAGYSLGSTAAADLTVPSLGGGTGGLRLSVPDTAATVVDAVGSAGGYSTGTPLPALAGSPAEQYAWLRLARTGVPQDTGDNLADFALISTSGGQVAGVQSMRGAPSPQSSQSPAAGNVRVASSLLDAASGIAASPNRVVAPGNLRTLTVRRVLTNTGTDTVTRLKLRLNSVSEENGAGPPTGSVPANPAWLRFIAPASPTTTISVGGQPVTVQNLSADPPAAADGSGLNSVVTVPLPAGGLTPGASVAVAFTFAIDRGGTFWFTYVAEG